MDAEYGLEIAARLFDHRAVLKSELRSFATHFDKELPDDKADSSLKKSVDRLVRANTNLGACCDDVPEDLSRLKTSIDSLAAQIETRNKRLLELEQELEAQREKARVCEQSQLAEHLADLAVQCKQIDGEFEQRERDIRKTLAVD